MAAVAGRGGMCSGSSWRRKKARIRLQKFIRRRKHLRQLLKFLWAEIRESIAFSHFGSAGSQKSSEIVREKMQNNWRRHTGT
jgi:hypothetical protein